ncbi:MAG: DUF3014 domain-containing protein [Gallionella sp.]|nr:DUF3014 domain-containing protein [Gallionella sp.]
MKKNLGITVALGVLLAGLAAFFLWQPSPPKPAPTPVQVQAPLPPPPKPEVSQVIETAPTPAPLPALGDSDHLVLDALAGLIDNKTLLSIFRAERIIRHIVATVDNLPRKRAPMNVMPVKRASGEFITADKEANLTISPRNAARYSPYVKIAQLADAKKLVELYVRLYPLFQQAYEELGYPQLYFNDRLIVALDDLLAAPDIKEPVRLVQPGVYYLFAEPGLEERSSGQRILMRIGSSYATVIKDKLREIRQELKLHMREKKVENAR